MCQINIDKYLLARYKQGGRTLPDVDCYGLVLEFFKNELKINLPLEQSITDISQAPEGEKNFKKIVKYAELLSTKKFCILTRMVLYYNPSAQSKEFTVYGV